MKEGKKINNIKWKNKYPIKYIDIFSNNYFRKPDIISKDKNDICIWYPKKNEKINLYGEKFPNIFTEHWCRDELITLTRCHIYNILFFI
tara:strand:+ start:57 stop:323 length:267 start_codon:yes stop_codon:yes gene_type:complete